MHSTIDGRRLTRTMDDGVEGGWAVLRVGVHCFCWTVGVLSFFLGGGWFRYLYSVSLLFLWVGRGGRGLLGCCVPFFVADNVIVGDWRLGFCWRWCGCGGVVVFVRQDLGEGSGVEDDPIGLHRQARTRSRKTSVLRPSQNAFGGNRPSNEGIMPVRPFKDLKTDMILLRRFRSPV